MKNTKIDIVWIFFIIQLGVFNIINPIASVLVIVYVMFNKFKNKWLGDEEK